MALTEPVINTNLWRANFTFSQDNRLAPYGQITTQKIEYSPPHNPQRAKPYNKPKLAEFQHTDIEKICEKTTEARTQYSAKVPRHIDTRDGAAHDALFKTNFKNHKDDRFETFKTHQTDHYPPKRYSKPLSMKNAAGLRPSVPFGDPDKVLIRESEMAGNYLYQNAQRNKPKFSHEKFHSRDHKVESGVLAGDHRNSHFITTNTEYFKPLLHARKLKYDSHPRSCVPFGDPEKVVEREPEAIGNYHDPKYLRSFEKQREVVEKIFRSNHKPGDERFKRADTTAKLAFPCHAVRNHRSIPFIKDRNKVSIAEGDLDYHRMHARINGSTAKDSYRPKTTEAYSGSNLLKTDKLITKSNVEFGRPHLNGAFFNAHTKDIYQKRHSEPVIKVKGKPSSVPMDYYKDYVGDSQMNDEYYRKTRVDAPVIDRDLHQRLKQTSFKPPRGNEFFAETTQRSAYTAEGTPWRSSVFKDLQRSVLPIGTLGTYIDGGYTGYNGYRGYSEY